MNDRNTEIHVTASGLTPFSLTSVDVASSLNNQGGAALTIKGFLNNVLTGTISIGSLGSGYTGVNGLSLGTIDLLTFDGSSVTSGFGGFVIDNLTLNDAPAAPVPEPASLAMWGLGAIGLVFARRKRQQTKLAA